MKNKQDVQQSYSKVTLDSPYDADHPPVPATPPESIKPDKEPMQMSDGVELMAPTPGEVCLEKYIRPGFVHDFVLAMRGTETTTLLSIWGALFTISGVLQRRSWQDWVIERLYPNLYVMFIARPGVCKKTVSITFGKKVIDKTAEVFHLPEDKEIFPIPMWLGGTTPEYLFELLKPKEVTLSDDAMSFGGTVDLGSRLAIVADEMTEFLGKQKYNQGMVSRLTKLYDCPDSDSVGTKKDKTQEVRNVFVNFCGGTTPSSFRDIIPDEAHGGGLMSRCVIVWQEHPTRQFAIPQRIKGIPDKDELARRLAWVAEHRMGEYQIGEEAFSIYEDWYVKHKSDLSNISDSDTRADIILVKTAHLIAASGYERGQVITADDMNAAIMLVELAMQHKKRAETELLTGSPWGDNILTVKRKIRQHGELERAQLLRSVSYKMHADELNKVLTTLHQQNSITIELHDQPRSAPGTSMKERYVWNSEEQ